MDAFAIVVAFIGVGIWYAIAQRKRIDAMSPDERQRYFAAQQEARTSQVHGPVNPAMICPHCNARGKVRTKPVDRKKGISGGKATAAVLTGGVSMLATGLSRKEHLTQARCDNCRNTWDF